MTSDPITIAEILKLWRDRICFADPVKLEDGRYATVVGGGVVSPIMLRVIIGYPHELAKGQAEVHRDTLFPAWWPERAFRQSQER